MTAFGVMQLVRNDFVRLVPKLPAGAPWPGLWPRLTALILLIAGVRIVVGKRPAIGAAAIGALLLVVLGLYAPAVAAKPGVGFMWTAPSKAVALLGGAVFLAGLGLNESARLWICRVFLGQFQIGRASCRERV